MLQRWQVFQYIIFLAFIFAFFSSSASGATATPDLRHEPIQPLPWPVVKNPGKVSLGEKLFNDVRLSRNNTISCYSCHALNINGADGLKRFQSQSNAASEINTPTVFNSRFNHRLFWDGRAANLEQQVSYVINGEQEFSSNWPEVVKKISLDSAYQESFNDLFSDGITANNIQNAIAAFEQTLVTVNSRFDQYLRGNNLAINRDEKQGYHLFKAYGCVACHQGKNVGGNLFQKLGVFKPFFDYGKEIKTVDLGRYNFTGKEKDKHVFRVPSLRLVALTPPYFHDGSAETLQDAIKIMAEYQLGRTIPDDDIQHIIAFLKTLPGEYQGKPVTAFPSENTLKKEYP